MAEVTLDDVPQKVRDFFNKGFGALERGRLDYSVEMLSTCLDMEPRLLQARKFLRAAEVQRYRKEKTNAVAKAISVAKTLPRFLVAQAMMKLGKNDKALKAANRLLEDNPLFKPYVMMYAKASEQAELPEAAVQMLEIMRDHYPEDGDVLEQLGRGYVAEGDTKKAIQCFEKLVDMRPNDSAALKELKDAMAVDSMTRDGWMEASEGGTFRDVVKDTDEARVLEQESKAVKTAEDVENLIEDARAKIETEPENINYYRALARLQTQKKDYGEAVRTLEKARALAPGDPEVDKQLADVKVAEFDSAIGALRDEGKSEEAAQKQAEREQFVFDNLQERVKRYPNDLDLRFRFGVMLYQNDYVTEAIQEFQQSQRNFKLRPRSLYYLGLCFDQKGQHDMALEQLQEAASDLRTMDQTKKDVIYALGTVSEKTGAREDALRYFKQIYQVDIKYRDVAEKVEKEYRSLDEKA